MHIRQRKYPLDEFARREEALYQQVVVPTLAASAQDSFVAIDIDSGCFEVDRSDVAAASRLLGRCPDAQIWMLRIGHMAPDRLSRVEDGGTVEIEAIP